VNVDALIEVTQSGVEVSIEAATAGWGRTRRAPASPEKEEEASANRLLKGWVENFEAAQVECEDDGKTRTAKVKKAGRPWSAGPAVRVGLGPLAGRLTSLLEPLFEGDPPRVRGDLAYAVTIKVRGIANQEVAAGILPVSLKGEGFSYQVKVDTGEGTLLVTREFSLDAPHRLLSGGKEAVDAVVRFCADNDKSMLLWRR